MYIYVVSKRSFHTLSSEVHGVNTKIRHQTIVSEGRLEEVKNNEKFQNRQPFTRSFNYKAIWENFGVLRGGRTWRFDRTCVQYILYGVFVTFVCLLVCQN